MLYYIILLKKKKFFFFLINQLFVFFFTLINICRYVSDITRVAWLLVNQIPAYELDTDFQTPVKLRSEKHQRHHSADRNSDIVKGYLWPALMTQNTYAWKAVVVTGDT